MNKARQFGGLAKSKALKLAKTLRCKIETIHILDQKKIKISTPESYVWITGEPALVVDNYQDALYMISTYQIILNIE